jgi:aspartate aminotransferase
MPMISRKGRSMPQSPIRKLAPLAEEAKRNGVKVYHLNIGQPDIKTPEVALDAVRNFDEKVVEYSLSEGMTNYREDLAKYYKKNGIDVTADQLMITTGGSEALNFVLGTCLDEGDEIIIPEPFYANYNGFSTALGVRVRPVTSYIESGFALPRIRDFENLISSKTKAILICNPGNPTGYLYSQKELEKLREICLKHDLYLIADEVYREFCYDGNKHHSILNLKGMENHAIVVDSVSKRYSMCGVRIGCIITRNADVMDTALRFAQARLSPPTFGQIAAHAALNTPDEYFDEVISEYVSRRDLLVEGLNSIEGVTCPKPKGAFYCVASLPVNDADTFASWLLTDFRLNGETVMLAPASGFYSTPGLGEKEVRVAYVLEKESLKKAVEILRQAIVEYPGSEL